MPGDGVQLQSVPPQVKERRKVPKVEGARTSCPSTAGVRPARRRPASSMHSPPASAEKMRVNPFTPALPEPGAPPRRTCSSRRSRSLSFSAKVADKSRPASATEGLSEKVTDRRERLWEDCI